jgi:hypothetical protein
MPTPAFHTNRLPIPVIFCWKIAKLQPELLMLACGVATTKQQRFPPADPEKQSLA